MIAYYLNPIMDIALAMGIIFLVLLLMIFILPVLCVFIRIFSEEVDNLCNRWTKS